MTSFHRHCQNFPIWLKRETFSRLHERVCAQNFRGLSVRIGQSRVHGRNELVSTGLGKLAKSHLWFYTLNRASVIRYEHENGERRNSQHLIQEKMISESQMWFWSLKFPSVASCWFLLGDPDLFVSPWNHFVIRHQMSTIITSSPLFLSFVSSFCFCFCLS